MNKALFSSKEVEWETPIELFNDLNKIYSFTLDPCASENNHKCAKYFTKEENGLCKSWTGERVFMNPPYGREIFYWLQKAYLSVKEQDCPVVVCLIPSRTDTQWWHKYVTKGTVTFLEGRVKFGGAIHNAPFPSAIVIFDNIRNL